MHDQNLEVFVPYHHIYVHKCDVDFQHSAVESSTTKYHSAIVTKTHHIDIVTKSDQSKIVTKLHQFDVTVTS